MLTTLLGLSGAFVFGSSDFFGGLAAKRLSSLLVTALSAVTGLVVLLLVLPVLGGAWSWAAVLWGALSGVSGAIALSLLYACLAIGPMSILSPLTAVVSAVVPMTVGLLGGARFGVVGYLGLGVALVAVILVGFVPERGAVRPTTRGILMAVGAGAMIGVFLILIDQTPDDSGIVPLLFNRAVNGLILFTTIGLLALLRARRRRSLAAAPDARTPLSPHLRRAVLLSLACGVTDATGNLLLLAGIHLGDLTRMSVLTALYPAGTIVLSAIALRERIAPVQIAGLVLALAAAAMLAVA